jgi:hypothetical protein
MKKVRQETPEDPMYRGILVKIKENTQRKKKFKYQYGLLWYKNTRLCIPASLKHRILEEHYDPRSTWTSIHENMANQYY